MSIGDVLKKTVGKIKPREESGEDESGLMLFYLPGCPYCRQAEEIIGALSREHPEYDGVRIRRVNEVAERALAEKYDYWYTPAFFLGGAKVYEADSGDSAGTVKEKLRAVLEKALEKVEEKRAAENG